MNNSAEKKILFIFNEGREQKLQNIEFYAKDFFYHYVDLKNENYDVDYIQISELNLDFNNWAIKFIEKLIRKLQIFPSIIQNYFQKKISQKLMIQRLSSSLMKLLFFLYFFICFLIN